MLGRRSAAMTEKEVETSGEFPEVDSTPPNATVRFHYIKSNFFRVVLADGAWGGVTPSGRIQIVFYNDRHPIPRVMTHKIEATKIGAELVEERQSKDGIVRECEVAVTLDVAVAEVLVEWLSAQVKLRREIEKTVSGRTLP